MLPFYLTISKKFHDLKEALKPFRNSDRLCFADNYIFPPIVLLSWPLSCPPPLHTYLFSLFHCIYRKLKVGDIYLTLKISGICRKVVVPKLNNIQTSAVYLVPEFEHTKVYSISLLSEMELHILCGEELLPLVGETHPSGRIVEGRVCTPHHHVRLMCGVGC